MHVIERWNNEELSYWRHYYQNVPNFRFHLHADNLEFKYPEVVTRLTNLGVTIHYTAPGHSSSNGLAERGIGVLDQKERTLRIARNMPECFREDAWDFAIFLSNIFPFRRDGKWHIDPHTRYKGRMIDYSKLRVPFSVCYVYNRQRIKGQDVRKGRKGIFCGYVPNSDAYKVWVLSESDYVSTGDVTWDEKQLAPLIKQALINEIGEKDIFSNPDKTNSLASSQDREASPHMGPVVEPPSPESMSNVSKEGGAGMSTGEGCSVNDDIFDWDGWLEVAMQRIGHFITSETRLI